MANIIKRVYIRAFTLFEITIAVAIFALAACGLFSLFIFSSTLADSAGYITQMMNVARQELEDHVLRTDFEALNSYFLLPPNIPAGSSLVCYVQDHDSAFCPDMDNMKDVRIVVTYRAKAGAITGEDRNLNGLLDAGEDLNNDGRITSPCEIVTFILRSE